MTVTDLAPATAAQRRTMRVLGLAQVLGGIGVGSGIAVSGLIAEDVSGSTALSGLSQTAAVLGAAVVALPLARVMAAHGRRPGLVLGYLLALTGAAVVVTGAVIEVFAVVLCGSVLFGSGSATTLQSRYAAADLATPAHRARALSTVVWATTVGVVLGPNLTGPGRTVARVLGLPSLTGPLLFSLLAFAAAAALIAVKLRPDPLVLARSLVEVDPDAAVAPRVTIGAALTAVRASSPALLALLAVSVAHTVMVSVMVMTPVHMRHHGASLSVVGLVISAHVAGMYAASPLAGLLADRWGRVPVMLVGQGLLVAAVVVSGGAPGDAPAGLGVGLALLGLGWSCCLVAGSTLLSESVSEQVRPAAQGVTDALMGACGAVGGALAGVVVAGPGYGVLNGLAGLLVVPVVVVAVLSFRRVAPRLT